MSKNDKKMKIQKIDNFYIIASDNLHKKTISHDCDRFNELKGHNSKQFCKHLIKLFLILKEKNYIQAYSILRYIYRHRNEFTFY